MTRTDTLSTTAFLDRLLSDEGGWNDATSLCEQIADIYDLTDVGVRWPAEGPLLEATVGSSLHGNVQYPLLVPNSAAGVFWANGPKKGPAKDSLKLLAAALSVSRTFQRFLAPFTDQERVAQRLDDAARVAGRVAHDLDNVFQGVMGFTTLALERLSPDSVVAGYLREAAASTESGMRFCAQLHQLSRAGNAKPFPGMVANAVQAEVERLRTHEKKCVLDVQLRSPLPPVAIDEGGLRQMLGHLLNNAVEASPAGSKVTVTARLVEVDPATLTQWLGQPTPGTNVEIVIRDEGSGMDADTLRRVFREPFLMKKFRHRGLSLTVVYRMLYAHRGGVRVESALGRGTVMTVVVPLTAPMVRNV